MFHVKPPSSIGVTTTTKEHKLKKKLGAAILTLAVSSTPHATAASNTMGDTDGQPTCVIVLDNGQQYVGTQDALVRAHDRELRWLENLPASSRSVNAFGIQAKIRNAEAVKACANGRSYVSLGAEEKDYTGIIIGAIAAVLLVALPLAWQLIRR